ncbi:MAG: hypothetical protein ACFFER_06430, partial [Candidatus Thorarchaeota archaeon]
MIADNALANLGIPWISRSGDTGKKRAEHRGFFQLWFTHNLRNRSYTTGARFDCTTFGFLLNSSVVNTRL